MSVSTGRFVVRRGGVVVDADASWTLGPALSSTDVAGADASVTWHHDVPVSALNEDYTTADYDGQDVTVDWVDEHGQVRVFTGSVDSTAAEATGAEWASQLSDGTRDRLTRTLDLRPMAATLPVNARFSSPGDGGRPRYVGLHGTWFTHQAMTQAGYDPGVPMHWSSVWYQSMCGSIATVPGRHHAWAPLGDLRQASALSSNTNLPRFLQGDTQIVAADVYALGSTSPPRPGTESLPWQLTFDVGLRVPHPVHGSAGEILLRHAGTTAGVALVWTEKTMTVQRHTAIGQRTTFLSVPRDGEDRWTLSVTGTTVRLRSNTGADHTATVPGLALPTGPSGICLVRVQSPGVIGPVAVTRGDRSYMITDAPAGRIGRGDQTGFSLPGWLHMPDVQAGRVLTDQADSHRGLRGQPIWSWIDGDGVLNNVDFDTLAGQDASMSFDVRPGLGGLALDDLAWRTDPPGGPWPAVEVRALSGRVLRRSTPSLLLTDEPSRQNLTNGEDYEAFLQPRPGEAWLEPDLRPRMAGYPYPTPPYPESYKHDLQRAVGTWLGGSRTHAQSREPRGWLQPAHMGWNVNSTGHVTGALEMLTPDRVLVKGTVNIPAGHDATTMPHENSGLSARRREQAFPQLRGYGLIRTEDTSVSIPIDGVDSRHAPYVHDCGMWVQNRAGLTRVASQLHDALTRPTPVRTARVQTTGRVRPGMKVELVERRPNGVVVTEHVVVASVSGETTSRDDSMTITGVVTHRAAVQTTPDGPPVDEHDDWAVQPPLLEPDPPRDTTPPPDEDEPGQDDPPGAPPARPGPPTLTTDLNVLTVRWDGRDVYGADALASPHYGTTEVALAPGPAPDDVAGWMETHPDGGQVFTYGPVPLDTSWWARVRVVDRWGTPSGWSDAATVQVDPLVDPAQFDDALRRLIDAEEGLDDLAAELAAGGHALPDPEFADPDAWTVPAGSIWLTDLTDHPFHRATAMQMPAASTHVEPAEGLPADEGQRWWMAVLVRADDATTSTALAGMEVRWTLEDGSSVYASVDRRPLRDYPVGEWVLLSGYATAPEGATGVRLRVWRGSSLAPAWTLGSARLLRASGGIADPVVLAGFGQFLRINVGNLVVTEGATINEAVILRLSAEIAEFIEVSISHLTAGTLKVLMDIAAQGGITAGVLETGGRAFMRGGTDGGIGFEVPAEDGTPVTVAKMGRDWVARDDDGNVTASITGQDGAVSGRTGDFSELFVAGADVGQALYDRPALVVNDDPGLQLRGYYNSETGYREIGLVTKPGHIYEVDARLHVFNRSGTESTIFTYMRYQTGSEGNEGIVATINSPEMDSDSARVGPGAEGRFRMTGTYTHADARQLRVLLSGRGGGSTQIEFARSRIVVRDWGPFEPAVFSGRYSRGGGGEPPPSSPPPQKRRQWFDFDWAQVFQTFGRANPNVGGLGNNLRQGRIGVVSSTYPYGTLLRIPDTARTAAMGASRVRAWIQLTNRGWVDGAPIVGQSTATTNPTTFPTPIAPTPLARLPRGATRLIELPRAWESRWQAGTNRSLTLGRVDSSGNNDALLDFAPPSAGASTRVRLYLEWEA